MVVKITDASRDGATLLIGLSGPSGSGKTLSALRLATGMAEVRGGPVVVLDTEGGRAKHYAPPRGEPPSPPTSYAFKLAVMDPPFSPERGLKAIEAVLKVEPAVLIIDSYSQFWEGPGGTLELASQEPNSTIGWGRWKPRHFRLMQRLQLAPCHVILCMRAEHVARPEKDPKTGRVTYGDPDWHVACERKDPYYLVVHALMRYDKKGVPRFDWQHGRCPHFFADAFKPGQPITEETGRALALWARGARAVPPAEGTAERAPQDAPAPRQGTGGALALLDADGGVLGEFAKATEWLAAYRELVAGAGDARAAVIAANHALLADLTRRARAKAPPAVRQAFEAELEAAEALVSDAQLETENGHA